MTESNNLRIYTAHDNLNNLVADIEKTIENNQHFVGFVLIALGIEIMGTLQDELPFNEEKMSSYRFKEGLKLFDSPTYALLADKLYKEFRCNAIHQYRPSNTFILSHGDVSMHFHNDTGKYTLIIEQFLQDFKAAKFILENKVRLNGILNTKANSAYLTVGTVSTDTPSSILIGEFDKNQQVNNPTSKNSNTRRKKKRRIKNR